MKIKLYDIWRKEEVLSEDFGGITTLESLHSGKKTVKEIIDIIINPNELIILVAFKEKAAEEALPAPPQCDVTGEIIF